MSISMSIYARPRNRMREGAFKISNIVRGDGVRISTNVRDGQYPYHPIASGPMVGIEHPLPIELLGNRARNYYSIGLGNKRA